MSDMTAQARALAGTHLVVPEDCWYSCPASGQCCNDQVGETCTCGYEERVKAITAALNEVRRETWREAGKDLSHGLPLSWKKALIDRCVFRANQCRAKAEAGGAAGRQEE